MYSLSGNNIEEMSCYLQTHVRVSFHIKNLLFLFKKCYQLYKVPSKEEELGHANAATGGSVASTANEKVNLN